MSRVVWRRVVISGLATVFVIAVVVLLGYGGVPPFTAIPGWVNRCDIVDSVPADAGSADPPPGTGVRVVEQGWSRTGPHREYVSIGAEVENTSDRIAYHTTVTFQAVDAGGTVISDAARGVYRVGVLLPGQRTGVGTTTTLNSLDEIPTAIQIGIVVDRWLPRDELGDDFDPVRAEYLGTDRQEREIHFVPRSTTCRRLYEGAPSGAALFRDTNGVLVGGAQDYPSSICTTFQLWGHEQQFQPYYPIPDAADDTRTEVHVNCDVAR